MEAPLNRWDLLTEQGWDMMSALCKIKKESGGIAEPIREKRPPVINIYQNYEPPEDYVKYMHDTFGHIINSKKEVPKDVEDFLGADFCTQEEEELPNFSQEQELTRDFEIKKDSLMKIDKKISLAKKFDIGIIAEKGYSNLVKQLILGESCDIKGNYSHKTHMILDFITDKLCSNKEFTAHLVIDRGDVKPYTVEDIRRCHKESGAIEIWATDGEIRNTLGLKRMSNREINKAVEDCADLEFEGKLYCYYNTETRELKSYDVGGAEKHFFGFVREKSGKVATRTGYEENSYCFRFNTILSNILLTNIMNGNIQIKPKEFYQLRGGLQNLGNYIFMWKNATFINLKTLCALLGIKSKNTTDQQKLCEDNLNEFKELGYITWVKFGKGIKARYKIWKKERSLKPEKSKLLPKKF